MDSVTISALLASQSSLVQEASEALPHSFSQCTYSLGHIRQAVYLCRTCNSRQGICSACSIACHTDHEQLELFPKRRFRCDCPTRSLAHSCTLHKHIEEPNTENLYGHNFDGTFCRCGREYDAEKERETMIQCLACEDWYHESCLNLRTRPSSREPTPEVPAATVYDGDARSDASSSGLPPPLVTASQYDSLVCVDCVRKIDTLRRYAGTPGVLMVVRATDQEPWRVIGQPESEETHVDVQTEEEAKSGVGEKRGRSASQDGGPQTKRARASPSISTDREQPNAPLEENVVVSTSRCLAPSSNDAVQGIFAAINSKDEKSSLEGAGDVFLTEGFRERWCRCSNCLPSLEANPYLLEEEETYEPPEDPDSGLSLEELGLRALQNMPRDRAINGIHAFNEMRDNLLKHLRPIAEQNREVTAADIHAFFEEAGQGKNTNS
ncbi:hypothetical protein BDY19DRAFT_893604 [Irpex rosettiformis]|uniref:Uncharacterized protein n=1 Tax=Irpex rosettiformis TaxID=378272 RepID=A0ACB8TYT3_9APHY|nr:hypothetical protein BDY19DRAFT_893604 [Irpex rosettiformis]